MKIAWSACAYVVPAQEPLWRQHTVESLPELPVFSLLRINSEVIMGTKGVREATKPPEARAAVDKRMKHIEEFACLGRKESSVI